MSMIRTSPSIRLVLFLAIFSLLAGCNLPALAIPTAVPSALPNAATPEATIPAPPPVPETLISFRVIAPANTPEGAQVFLTLLDEVTGLALNAVRIPMEVGAPTPESGDLPVFVLTLPFAIGTVIQYRYERSAEFAPVAEHLSDGSAVRYRIYHVTGQGLVDDVISRWTDTAFEQPHGRILGKVLGAQDGKPLPSVLIAAGGAQTTTASDGSFLLEGLPPGVHNLAAYAMDGAYRPFQQGARVAAESTTPAEIRMHPAAFTNVVFAVRPPEGTLPVVPLRMAGNLYPVGQHLRQSIVRRQHPASQYADPDAAAGWTVLADRLSTGRGRYSLQVHPRRRILERRTPGRRQRPLAAVHRPRPHRAGRG